MASATTDTTYDVSGKVSLFRTIIFAMADASTVLTYLVLVVAKGAVQSGKFAELIALVVVLALWRGGSLARNKLSIYDTGSDSEVKKNLQSL